MKAVLWIVATFVALVWTGLAALTAEVVAWGARQLAAPGTDALGGAAAALTLPSWLAPWVDTATWNAWVQAVAGAAAALERAFPALGGAVEWLVPLVWAGWGFGMVALLALALVGHWGLGRFAGRLPTALRPG